MIKIYKNHINVKELNTSDILTEKFLLEFKNYNDINALYGISTIGYQLKKPFLIHLWDIWTRYKIDAFINKKGKNYK